MEMDYDLTNMIDEVLGVSIRDVKADHFNGGPGHDSLRETS